MSGGICVRNRVFSMIAALVAVLLLTCGAWAENMISTTVVLRVSRMTQSAVVDAGEDLLDGGQHRRRGARRRISGISKTPPSPARTRRSTRIVNAQPEDTGLYRMDAFDGEGRMVVSMDISARVDRRRTCRRRAIPRCPWARRWPPWPPRRVCSSSRAAAKRRLHKQTPFSQRPANLRGRRFL